MTTNTTPAPAAEAPASPAEGAQAPAAAVTTPEAAPEAVLSPFDAAVALLKADRTDPEAAKEPEAPKEPAKEPEKKPVAPEDKRFADKFATIARQERQLREEKEALKRERAEMEPLQKAWKSGSALELLQARGMTYEQATKEAITGKFPVEAAKGPDPEVASLKAKVEQMEKVAAQAREEAAVSTFKGHISRLATSEPDKYELVNANNAHGLVYDLIDAHYRANQALPGDGTHDGAIKHTLDALEAQYEADAVRLLTTKKLQAKLQPVAPKRAAAAPAIPGQKLPAKTLTNAQASAAPTRPSPGKQSPADYQEAAAAVLRSQGS